METIFGLSDETSTSARHATAEFPTCIPVIDGLSRIFIADEDCSFDDEDPEFPVQQIDLLDKSRLSSNFLELTTEGLQIFGRTENEMQQYGFSNDKRREIVHNHSQQIIALLRRLSSRSAEESEPSIAPHMETVLSMWWLADIMFFRCFYNTASPTVPKPLEEFHLLYQLHEWQNYHTANDYEIAQFIDQLSAELAAAADSILPPAASNRLFPTILRLFVQQMVHATIDVAIKLFAVIRQHFSDSLQSSATNADSEAEIQCFEQLLLDCPLKNWISWLANCNADQRSRQFSDWQKQCQYIFHQSKFGCDLLHYCVGLMSGEKTIFALDRLEKLIVEIGHGRAASHDHFGAGAEAAAIHTRDIAGVDVREPAFTWHQRFLCLLFYEDLLATPYSLSRNFVRFRNQHATPAWFIPSAFNDEELNKHHLTFAAGNAAQIVKLIAALFLRDPKVISEHLSGALNDCCWTALHFAHLCRHLPPSSRLDTAAIQKYFRNIVLRYGESLLAFGWMPYKTNSQSDSAASNQSGDFSSNIVEGLDFVIVAFDYLMLCGTRGRACISAFVDRLSPTIHIHRTLPFLHNVRALIERHKLPLESSLLHLKLAEACCYAVTLADADVVEQQNDDSDIRDEIHGAASIASGGSGDARVALSAAADDPFTSAVEHAARAARHYPKLSLRLLKQLSARPNVTRKQLALILNHLCKQMQLFSRFDLDPDFPLITRALSIMVGMELKYQLDTVVSDDNEQQIDDNPSKKRISGEDASFLIATTARCVRKCRSLAQATKVVNDFLAHFAECIGDGNFSMHSYRLLETAIAVRSSPGIPLVAALQKLKLFARQKLKELLLAQPELLQPPGGMPHDAEGSVHSAGNHNRQRKRSRVSTQDISAVLNDQIELSDIDEVEVDPMEISSPASKDESVNQPSVSTFKPPVIVKARKRVVSIAENADRRRRRRESQESSGVGIDTVDADDDDDDANKSDNAEQIPGLKPVQSFRRRSLMRHTGNDVETDGGDSDSSSSSGDSSRLSVIDERSDEDNEEKQRPTKFARTGSRSPSKTMRKSITYVEQLENPTPLPPTSVSGGETENAAGSSTTFNRRKSPTKIRIRTREVVIVQTPLSPQNVDASENDAPRSSGISDQILSSMMVTPAAVLASIDEAATRDVGAIS